MSEFGKTLIVDADTSSAADHNTIKAAVEALPPTGGTVIVEEGTYEIDGVTPGKETVSIPSNVTIIGRGNAIVKVTATDAEAFKNADQTDGNENIRISGLKFVVELTSGTTYASHLIFMTNVKNSVIEKLYITTDPSNDGVAQGKAAIFLYSKDNEVCADNIIRQCIIENFGKTEGSADPYSYRYGSGIVVSDQSAAGNCKRNKIINNIVSNCSTNCYLYFAENTLVSGNIFSSSQPKATKLEVHDDITGCCGILNSNSKYSIIQGNQLLDNIEHGKYSPGCEGTVLIGNVARNNGLNGYKFRFSSYNSENKYSTILGNIASQNGYAKDYYDGLYTAEGFTILGHSKYKSIVGNIAFKNNRAGITVGELKLEGEDTHDIVLLGNITSENDMYQLHVTKKTEGGEVATRDIIDTDNIESS